MLISSVALLAFMFFVSFTVWPRAVLVMSFLTGVLVTLQYLLFGAHRAILGIRWAFKKIVACLFRLPLRDQDVEPAEKEKDDDTPTPTEKGKIVGSGEGENEKKT